MLQSHGRDRVRAGSGCPVRLDAEELQRANEAVAKSVVAFGLEPDPRLATIMRSSQTDAEWTELVLDLYSAGPSAPTKDRVSLIVLEDKQTHEYRVVVRDLDSLRQTDFTNRLEAALVQALSTAVPARRAKGDSKIVGPAFGP
jgi:hypothetical protein